MPISTARLVDVVLPFVAQGATALALAALIAGCDCTSMFLVPLTEEEGAALRDAYDGGNLPEDVCNELCVPPWGGAAAGGAPPTTAEEAGFAIDLCHVVRDEKGPAVFCKGYVPESCIGGRRPARLASPAAGAPPARPRGGDEPVAPDGAAFGALARMESASVLAFVELAVELCAHGAPDRLVRRALAAAVDEVRHAQAAAKLARAHGAEAERAVVAIAGIRPFPALLRDNAVEGIVLEGWGAIAAASDARAARDPGVRRALSEIAADEARHAHLAHAIDVWASDRAGPAARAHAREAKAEALHDLVAAVERGAPLGLGATGTDRAVQRARRFAVSA